METYIVIGIFPVSKARKSLNNFHAFPAFLKGLDSIFVGKFLNLLE